MPLSCSIGGTTTIVTIVGITAALVAYWRMFGEHLGRRPETLARADAAEAGRFLILFGMVPFSHPMSEGRA